VKLEAYIQHKGSKKNKDGAQTSGAEEPAAAGG